MKRTFIDRAGVFEVIAVAVAGDVSVVDMGSRDSEWKR
jgi:hypothetical protein